MNQNSPTPTALFALVEQLEYRPGWTFQLTNMDRGQGCQGLTLDITTLGYNSYHPDLGETYQVHHLMAVPPAAYDAHSWRRWLFDQLLLVERHEAMEFFRINGERPYGPHHGPGHDPYVVFELGTEIEARTSFRGTVNPDGAGDACICDHQRAEHAVAFPWPCLKTACHCGGYARNSIGATR